jgi:hypothetical protein
VKLQAPRTHQANRYRAYGLTLQSDIALIELPTASGTPDIVIGQALGEPPDDGVDWFRTCELPNSGGTTWLRIGRHSSGYMLHFPGLGDFGLSDNGHAIRVWLRNGVAEATTRHLLLDQVLPLALSVQGRCVLHAAGVVADSGGAIAFAAEAGAGKSTLTSGQAVNS